MTKKQEEYKKQLIQKIQINKYNVFEDDQERKEFMLSRFGVESLKDMTIDELNLLLNFCTKKVSDIKPQMLTTAQFKKIFDLWRAKAILPRLSALVKFIKRITGKWVDSPNELTKQEATKVIVALEKMR